MAKEKSSLSVPAELVQKREALLSLLTEQSKGGQGPWAQFLRKVSQCVKATDFKRPPMDELATQMELSNDLQKIIPSIIKNIEAGQVPGEAPKVLGQLAQFLSAYITFARQELEKGGIDVGAAKQLSALAESTKAVAAVADSFSSSTRRNTRPANFLGNPDAPPAPAVGLTEPKPADPKPTEPKSEKKWVNPALGKIVR